jgi:hypothetical protein
MPSSYFFKIHNNIILPSMPRSSKCLLSFRFPHHNHVRIPLHPHAYYMPAPTNPHRSIALFMFNDAYKWRSSTLCIFSPHPPATCLISGLCRHVNEVCATQRSLVVPNRRYQHPDILLRRLDPEEGTDWLSRNVGTNLPR